MASMSPSWRACRDAVVARAEEVLRALEEGREGHKPLARIDDLPLFGATAPVAQDQRGGRRAQGHRARRAVAQTGAGAAL